MELEQRLTTLTAKAKDAEDAKGMNSRIKPTDVRLPVPTQAEVACFSRVGSWHVYIFVSRILKRFNPGQVR